MVFTLIEEFLKKHQSLQNPSILKDLNFEQNNLTDKQLEIIRYESGLDKDLENQLFLENLFV
jgi:predicted DNA binding protein